MNDTRKNEPSASFDPLKLFALSSSSDSMPIVALNSSLKAWVVSCNIIRHFKISHSPLVTMTWNPLPVPLSALQQPSKCQMLQLIFSPLFSTMPLQLHLSKEQKLQTYTRLSHPNFQLFFLSTKLKFGTWYQAMRWLISFYNNLLSSFFFKDSISIISVFCHCQPKCFVLLHLFDHNLTYRKFHALKLSSLCDATSGCQSKHSSIHFFFCK